LRPVAAVDKIGPVKRGVTAAALAAGMVFAGAGTAWAGFVAEAGSPYAVGTDPYSVYAADFNGDGRPDVATINGTSSNVSVFLRQAGGGFAQELGSPLAVGSGPSSAAVGDYNGDGRPDLAVSAYNTNQVTILLRNAQNTGFTAPVGTAIDTRAGRITITAAQGKGKTASADFYDGLFNSPRPRARSRSRRSRSPRS
jgi:hypothetical protein